MSKCPRCSEPARPRDLVQCSGPCDQDVHMWCAKLAPDQLQAWHRGQKFEWKCADCRYPSNVIDLMSVESDKPTVRSVLTDGTEEDIGREINKNEVVEEDEEDEDAILEEELHESMKAVDRELDSFASFLNSYSTSNIKTEKQDAKLAEVYHMFQHWIKYIKAFIDFLQLEESNDCMVVARNSDPKHAGVSAPEVVRDPTPELVAEKKDYSVLFSDRKLLLRIFQHLDASSLRNVRLTCSRWHRIVNRTASLMGKFVLKFPVDTILDQRCEQDQVLSKSKNRYQKATLRGLRIVEVRFGWLSEIRSLSISNCIVSLETLLDLLKAMPQLQCLRFTGDQHVICNPKPYVNVQLRLLEELILHDIQQPAVVDFFKLLCPRLRVLKVPQVVKSADFAEKLCEFVLAVSETLEDLQVGVSVQTQWWQKMISGDRLRLKRLAVGELNFNGAQEEQFIAGIVKQTALQHLAIGGVTSAGLRKIGQGLPKLTSLQVYMALEEPTFVDTMTQLKQLTISGGGVSKDLSLCLPNLNLKTLVLQGINPGMKYYTNYPNLTCLQLLGYKGSLFADWSEVFTPIGQLKALRSLTLQDINVGKGASDSFASTLGNLESLHLTNCNISANLLKALLALSEKLQDVSFDSIQNIDDGIISGVCGRLDQLKSFSARNCNNLTEAVKQHLTKHCTKLQHLAINGQ